MTEALAATPRVASLVRLLEVHRDRDIVFTITMSTQQTLQLFDRDAFAKLAGITVLEGRPGYARCRMLAGPQHMNGLDMLHGGAIFSLADVAFAVASNLGERAAVAIDVSINYIKAGGVGEYFAEAKEVSLQERLGVYDVRITNAAGELIAVFHGLAYRKHLSMAQAIEKLPPR